MLLQLFIFGVLAAVPLPALALPQVEEATVPSVCNPVMPLSVYNKWAALKSACVCSANAQRESCYARTFAADDMNGYFLCEIRNCQNLNLCELVVPCAQTIIPGLSIDNCGLTDHDYPELSISSWLYDPVGDTTALACVVTAGIDMSGYKTLKDLKNLVTLWKDLISSTGQIVVGSNP
ncbi:hypothetical protein OQA88_7724 [Cercophora sp. LCS_1]